MSQRQLVLVWDRGRVMGNKSKKDRQAQQGSSPSVTPLQSSEGSAKAIIPWLEANRGLLGLVAGFVLTLVGIGIHIGTVSTQSTLVLELRKEIDAALDAPLKEIKDDIEKLQTDMAAVKQEVGIYKEEAASLGLQDPQIIPTRIAQSQTIQKLDGEIPYYLIFTLKEVTKDYVKFFLDGKIGTTEFERNILSIQYQVGVPFNLADALRRFGVNTPPLWVAVLDRPTSSTVILAIGPRLAVPS